MDLCEDDSTTEAKTWEWILQHMGVSTGSSLAAQIGWSVYDTAAEAFLYCIGMKERSFTEFSKKCMEWGDVNEPNNIETFARLWKVKVSESPFVYDTVYKWMRVTPDFKIDVDFDGNPSGGEAKSPVKIHQDIKTDYIPQLYMEMRTYGWCKIYLSVWTPTEVKAWLFLWQSDVWSMIITLAHRFRQLCKARQCPTEEIIPLVGGCLQRWSSYGFNPEYRERIAKVTNVDINYIPKMFLHKLVLHCEGVFKPREDKFQVTKTRVNLKQRLEFIVKRNIKPKDTFEHTLLWLSKLQAEGIKSGGYQR
jgi:hypothetical protein